MTRTVELLVSSLLVVLLIVLGVATMPAADAHPQFDAGRTAQLSIHKTASSTDTAQEPLAGVVFGIQKVNGKNFPRLMLGTCNNIPNDSENSPMWLPAW